MKCRKFQKIKENRQTSCCVIPLGMAWSCCLFYLSRSPTTSFTKISFQHHAFFFIAPLGVSGDENLGYDVLCCIYKWSNRDEANLWDVAPSFWAYSILRQMPYLRIVPTLSISKFQRRNSTPNRKWRQANICYLQLFCTPSHNRIRGRTTKPRCRKSRDI